MPKERCIYLLSKSEVFHPFEHKCDCLSLKSTFMRNEGSFIFPFLIYSGRAGAVDSECWLDPGKQRPELPAAEDSIWTDTLLLHPSNLPLHI